MVNDDWFGATNNVLDLAQLDLIATRNAFDNPVANLTKYQRAARAYVRLAHMHLSIKAYKHFATRRIVLNIDQTGNTYQLDLGINPEHIMPSTFFNTTQNEPASAQNRELKNWTYHDFLTKYPDQNVITSGPPQAWILLPIDRANISPVWNVRIFPNPDQPYELEYQAVLNAPALNFSTDTLLWPPEYEFALWEFAWDLLERGLGEGKEGRIAEMAEQAVNQVRLVSGKPADERKTFRLMRGIRRPRSRGWVLSPASIDAGGNVID